MASPRLPRFARARSSSPIQVTARDIEIIRQAFQHRFLRSTHLTSLLGGSRQQILRRLQQLFHHGYLDRPLAQLDHYRHGSQPMVYGLGNKGMELLERQDGIPRRKLDWTARNRAVGRYFMEHTLAVADVMVALELSCRKHDIELVRYHPPSGDCLKWSVRVRHGGVTTNIGIVPDQVFGLKDQRGTRWFFLEADRGTMPVERNNFKQTSLMRKLIAYHQTWRQKVVRAIFPRFRVLTVTTTADRVENLLKSIQQLSQHGGAGLFLLSDHKAFTAPGNALSSPLLNGCGRKVALMS
jgi:hypothetical protein